MKDDGKHYPVDANAYILDAVERFGGMQSVSSAQVLMDIYESYFQLYPHLDPKKPVRPLASVALLPGEVLDGDGNRLEKSMETYITSGVKEFFDIPYLDFMELPPNVVKTMLKVARAKMALKKKEQEALEAALGGGKPPGKH